MRSGGLTGGERGLLVPAAPWLPDCALTAARDDRWLTEVERALAVALAVSDHNHSSSPRAYISSATVDDQPENTL